MFTPGATGVRAVPGENQTSSLARLWPCLSPGSPEPLPVLAACPPTNLGIQLHGQLQHIIIVSLPTAWSTPTIIVSLRALFHVSLHFIIRLGSIFTLSFHWKFTLIWFILQFLAFLKLKIYK